MGFAVSRKSTFVMRLECLLRSASLFFFFFLFLQLILEKQKLFAMQLHLRLSENKHSDSVCWFYSLFKVQQPDSDWNF